MNVYHPLLVTGTKRGGGAVADRYDLVDEFMSKIDRRDITVGDNR